MAIADGNDTAALQRAAAELAAGELVAFPTETVYGLGARADDDVAVAKIFAAKGRPADHPLIVHVGDIAGARAFASEWPASAQRLAAAFWPGPLTVIVPRRPGMAAASAAGQSSIGLRCPAHPVARALLDAAAALGVAGVAGPSANRFGRISPTTAAHVHEEFGDGLTIVDGGECEAGIESAIVDCSRGAPALLRPGVLTRAQIEAALGEPLRAAGADAPRASGTLEAHYAPRAKLRLMSPEQLRAALDVLPKSGVNPVAVYFRTVAPGGGARACRAMPDNPIAAAHELFSALRELDASGANLIWVETPPDAPAWEGVRDRLQRAAAA
jgi:L-threonylcarbamoyladenylate synthase